MDIIDRVKLAVFEASKEELIDENTMYEMLSICESTDMDDIDDVHQLMETVDELIDVSGGRYLEACKDEKTARKFCSDFEKLAKKYNANFFLVTDGASITRNDGNSAVSHARECHKEWERKHGHDPDEDWVKDKSITV